MGHFKKYHWLMLVVTVLIVAFSVYYPLANYERLPDKIPTHFNIAGQPDSWSAKSIGQLLFGQLLTIPILFIMFPLVWWVASVEEPRKLLNIPRKNAQKMSLERAEKIRRILLFHILLIMLLVALLVMVLAMGQVQVALNERQTLGWGMPVIVALLLGDSMFLTWRLISLV